MKETKHKPLTLVLANGKEESFSTGEEMYNWYEQQKVLQSGGKHKKRKDNVKKVSE